MRLSSTAEVDSTSINLLESGDNSHDHDVQSKNTKTDEDEQLTVDEKLVWFICDRNETDEHESLLYSLRVQNSTTPLWKLSYSEQLAKKKQDLQKILVTTAKKIQNVNFGLNEWIKQQKWSSILQETRNQSNHY